MDFEMARHNMVESQIRPNRVTDERLIGAMARLPRSALGIYFATFAVVLKG